MTAVATFDASTFGASPFPAASPPATPDVTPPTVDNFVPPINSPLQPFESVSFDVKDNLGQFCAIFVITAFVSRGDEEATHDSAIFSPRYRAGSSRIAITNGFRYTLARTGGWPVKPTFRIIAIDPDGNQAVTIV